MLIGLALRARGVVLDIDDTTTNTSGAPRDAEGVIPPYALSLVPGMRECLEMLRGQGVFLAALTTGSPQDQKLKLASLGIEEYFDPVIVVAHHAFKPIALRDIIIPWKRKYNIGPEQVVVVGDRVDCDIYAGNCIGAMTVRMRCPGAKYSLEEPANILEVPDYTVASGAELLALPPFARVARPQLVEQLAYA